MEFITTWTQMIFIFNTPDIKLFYMTFIQFNSWIDKIWKAIKIWSSKGAKADYWLWISFHLEIKTNNIFLWDLIYSKLQSIEKRKCFSILFSTNSILTLLKRVIKRKVISTISMKYKVNKSYHYLSIYY